MMCEKRLAWALAGACSLLATLPMVASAASKSLEIRRHWVQNAHALDAKEAAKLAAEVPDARSRDILAGKLEASLILRNWYPSLPQGGRWTPKGAVRAETIVLFDLGAANVRFGWWTDTDFADGRDSYVLRIWRKGSEKVVMTFKTEHPSLGNTMKGYLDNGKVAAKSGSMADIDAATLLTFDFAGRRLVIPLSEWTEGLRNAEERGWLTQAIETDSDLKASLEDIAVVANLEPELNVMCTLVIQPLLREDRYRCSPEGASFLRLARKPDCDFDSWFGETCSLEQSLEFRLRKQPVLAPPPTP